MMWFNAYLFFSLKKNLSQPHRPNKKQAKVLTRSGPLKYYLKRRKNKPGKRIIIETF